MKKNDFIKVEFDLYADDVLINTTNEKLAKKENVENPTLGEQIIILGKNTILKKMDEQIISGKTNEKLELEPKDAYGLTNLKLVKKIKEEYFKQNDLKPLKGMAYNMEEGIGVVTSISEGMVFMNFNHLLAGKKINLDYKVTNEKVDLKEKIEYILIKVLQLPKTTFDFKINKKEKNVELNFIIDCEKIKKIIENNLLENISELKDFKLNFNFQKV